MFFADEIKNKKWQNWCKKTEEESEKIAEENGWDWYFEWFDVGNRLWTNYIKADESKNPTSKFGGYDRWDEEHEVKYSYVYLGSDASFHESKTPTNQWTEYNPCTNKNCRYNQGKYANKNVCGYFSCNERMFDCFGELFASIQAYVDVCGIENIDELHKKHNIHKDIIGWFKYGDDYFKGDDNMSKPFWVALSEIKGRAYELSVFWTDGMMYINDKNDSQASTNTSLFQAYRFALLLETPQFDYEATDEEVKEFQKELLEFHKDDFSEEEQEQYIVDVWDYLDDIATDYYQLTGIQINDIDFKREIVSYMSETDLENEVGMGFGSATYIARLIHNYIMGDEKTGRKGCNDDVAIKLAKQYLPTDTYNLQDFAKALHNISKQVTININGVLWVNCAKYEYVDKIIINEDDVDIYYKNKIIGCIARENINTIEEQYLQNGTIRNITDRLDFDIKKVGDF